MRGFTPGRMAVAGVVCAAVVAVPVAALAATGTFSSHTAATPAVSAKNSSSGTGAKAIYGTATAGHGTTYGVYGRAASDHGYGVYSAGRLGASGALVCSHCVGGSDIDAATLPTVPDADRLGGRAPSAYARIVPLSDVLPADGSDHQIALVDGLRVMASCSTGPNHVYVAVASDSGAGTGTVNYFAVTGTSAQAGGFALDTTFQIVAGSTGGTQTEGSVVYRNDASGRVITIDFHLFGDGCQVFGNLTTAG